MRDWIDRGDFLEPLVLNPGQKREIIGWRTSVYEAWKASLPQRSAKPITANAYSTEARAKGRRTRAAGRAHSATAPTRRRAGHDGADQAATVTNAMAPIVIELLGHPRGKGRPGRARLKNGITITHPLATAEFEGNLKFAAGRARAGQPPLDGPVKVLVEARFRPKLVVTEAPAGGLAGTIVPTVTPDLCNIFGVTDGCNGVVWGDERQIVEAKLTKVYGDRPRLVISVWPACTSVLRTDRAAR